MKHTKGPWEYQKRRSDEYLVKGPTGAGYIATVYAAIVGDGPFQANAELIASAPTAPHDCDPDCPGGLNKKRLEMFEEMVAAITDALANCEQCRGEKGSRRCARCQTFEKLIAKVKGE